MGWDIGNILCQTDQTILDEYPKTLAGHKMSGSQRYSRYFAISHIRYAVHLLSVYIEYGFWSNHVISFFLGVDERWYYIPRRVKES